MEHDLRSRTAKRAALEEAHADPAFEADWPVDDSGEAKERVPTDQERSDLRELTLSAAALSAEVAALTKQCTAMRTRTENLTVTTLEQLIEHHQRSVFLRQIGLIAALVGFYLLFRSAC